MFSGKLLKILIPE